MLRKSRNYIFERVFYSDIKYVRLVTMNDYSSTTNFDSKVAQLHDWLRLVEQQMKGMSFSVGDHDDMETAIKKQIVSVFILN